jgi:capsular exopolysaccharide synthesis family protein
MSKNFELMQQLGNEAEHARTAIPSPNIGSLLIDRDNNVYSKKLGLADDSVSREESLKLVQRLFLPQRAKGPRAVVFAGIDRGSGCSRICGETASVLAENNPGSVCVVDADLRAPSLPQFFGVTNHRGLTDALFNEGSIRSFAKQVRRDNLWLLSCGSLAMDSRNILNSKDVQVRFAELRNEFDYILVDVPPVNQYADAIALGQIVDGLVLVVEANSTRKESALKAIESLRVAQVEVLGAVLNKRTFPIPELLYRRF